MACVGVFGVGEGWAGRTFTMGQRKKVTAVTFFRSRTVRLAVLPREEPGRLYT